MVKRANEIALLAAGKKAHGAETDRYDAVVLSRVGPGWTRALCLVERDRLAFECGFDVRIEHLDRETETWHRVPIGVRADGPVVEARVASTGNNDGLEGGAAVAERSAVDDRVVVADLAVGAEHRGRDIGQPEVLVAEARRPGCGQLQLRQRTSIGVDRIRDETERDRVATTEQARAVQLTATGIGRRADAVVEEAAEVIAGTGPGRLDVDAREHRPAPLVVRKAALRRAGLRARRAAGRTRIVSRVDLVGDHRRAKPAPGLVDREVHPRRRMLIGPERGGWGGADRNNIGGR